MEIVRPPRLKIGDTIGLIAPSKSARFIPESVWRRGIARLHNKGFEVVEGEAIRGTLGQTGDTVQARAIDAERMFRRDDIDAVMAICGGSNANQLLDELDYEMIGRHPKIVIGFSDTTALTAALHAKLGWVTFSGPNFLTFCEPELPEYTELFFDQILTEASRTTRLKPAESWAEAWKSPYLPGREWSENPGWQVVRHGKATGRTLAGNLETLLVLAGTPYWPDCADAILFLESCADERPATIHRSLTQLRQMGVFSQIAGLVVGRFPAEVSFDEHDTLKIILDDATRGTKFPILTNVDFGHTDPLLTLPLGVSCQMDTYKQELILTEAAVA